jgi:predicted AAA+ superfamily ATPase
MSISAEHMQRSEIKEIILTNQRRQYGPFRTRDLAVECVPESASVITGARRCGKTYRSYQFIADLLSGGSARESICRVPFDDLRLSRLHAEQLRGIDTAYYALLRFLKEAYAVDTVSIFTESTRVRQRNYRKAYVRDWALAVAVAMTAPPGSSRKLETLVHTELRRRGKSVHYLMHEGGGEIDFVARDKTGAAYEIFQVCQELTEDNTAREVDPLPDTCRFVGADHATIVTLWEERDFVKDGIPIRVVPAWQWLLQV